MKCHGEVKKTAGNTTSRAAKSRLQRKCPSGGCKDREDDWDKVLRKPLQSAGIRQASGLVVPVEVDRVLGSPGRPLDGETSGFMHRRLGYDFGQVRIHDDAQAAQSAAAVAARAYTVGNHVVFGAGEYRPGSLSSQRLLAHELTHVVQQGRSSLLGDTSRNLESEAERVERAVADGRTAVPVSRGGLCLARNGTEEAGDEAQQADAAEAACDIPTLCRLHFRNRELVPDSRVSSVFAACHPSISPTRLAFGSPCLTPNFGLPAPVGSPRTAVPGGTADRQASASAGTSGGLALPSTTISFGLGPARVSIDLPTSMAIRLPIPFRGAERVVFELNARTDEFSFSATINGVPHVRIIARTALTTAGQGSAQLVVQSTRTVCRAQEAAAARTALQSAGERLRDAIIAAQNPQPAAADASAFARAIPPAVSAGAEIIGAIVAVNSAIERARGACRQVPLVSAEFGARGQIVRPDEGQESVPTYVGGGLTLHF